MKFLSLVLLFGMLGASDLAADEKMPRSVSVTGEASILAPPDRASITASVQSRNLELASARSKVANVSARFLALCKKLRIDALEKQAKNVEIRARGGKLKPKNRRARVPRDDEHYMWGSNGEIWRDEVGSMYKPVTDRCPERPASR